MIDPQADLAGLKERLRPTFIDRLCGSLSIGVAAFWFARGIGIPAWRYIIWGDAVDVGALVFFGVFLLMRGLVSALTAKDAGGGA